MKRPFRFRAMKYSIRGAFFSFFFIVKMMSRFVKWLNTIKTDALSNMGLCPVCKSPDLDYDDWYIQGTVAYFPFKCESCKHKGTERYTLRYIASIAEKEIKNECNAGTTEQSNGDGVRATEATELSDRDSEQGDRLHSY